MRQVCLFTSCLATTTAMSWLRPWVASTMLVELIGFNSLTSGFEALRQHGRLNRPPLNPKMGDEARPRGPLPLEWRAWGVGLPRSRNGFVRGLHFPAGP